MSDMKVAIDVGPLTSGDKIRGVGVYTKELIKSLDSEHEKSKNINLEIVKLDSDTIRKTIDEFDIVHIPYFNPFALTVPYSTKSKIVVTIHDVIPLIYPKNYPPGFRGKIKLIKQKNALKRVGAIITDSETSKKDIVRFLGVKSENVHVVYLGPKKSFVSSFSKMADKTVIKKYNLPSRYVLYVGDVNYNKNVINLTKACSKANIPLVIVGKQANDIQDSFKFRKVGIRDMVRFVSGGYHPEVTHLRDLEREFIKNETNIYRLGFVGDDDLVSIYKFARLYCQPSLYEGFGLPVAEAISIGVPVLSSKTQALVEIYEDLSDFVDTKNIDEFTKELERLINNPPSKSVLIGRSSKLKSKYNWMFTAKKTIDVWKMLVK